MSVTRIGRLFERLQAQGSRALVAYVTAGDPSLKQTPRLVAALERGGADLIELGVPFSDPIADGPVIQRASDRALRAGATLAGVLEVAREIRRRSEIPIVLFTYLNPVLKFGLQAIGKAAADAGVDGCLLTDLSVEEAEPYVTAMRSARLDTIFLAAPTSTPERRKLVAEYSSGFVYLVSRTGVTGEQAQVSAAVEPLVASMRAITSLPLAVGFGVSRPEQAAQVARTADAVVVGSAIVKLIETHGQSAQLEEKLEDFTRSLKSAMPVAAGSQA
jgi:tryptophan synthase alpha chain